MYQLIFKRPSERVLAPLARPLVGLAVAFLSILTGCSTATIVRERPSPELTRHTPEPKVDVSTNGGMAKGLMAYRASLERCNIDKANLRDWAEAGD